MAKKNSFSIDFGMSEVIDLADTLGNISSERLGAITVAAINEVTERTYDLSRKAILGGINLTDAYVQSKMSVELATKSNPKATIVAHGGKGYLTGLSHYGALQSTQAVTWSNERIKESGRRFSDRWPGWVRRTGDAKRGIEVGQKTAGVSVAVTGRKQLKTSKAIIIPKFKDSEGNALVFKRIGGSGRKDSKLVALQGPSVYQLFRVAAASIEESVYGDLERTVVLAAETEITKDLA